MPALQTCIMHYANIRENFCEPEKEKKLDFQSVGVCVYTYMENKCILQSYRCTGLRRKENVSGEK